MSDSPLPEVIFECIVDSRDNDGDKISESFRVVRIPDTEDGESWKRYSFYIAEKLQGSAAMGEPRWEPIEHFNDYHTLIAEMAHEWYENKEPSDG